MKSVVLKGFVCWLMIFWVFQLNAQVTLPNIFSNHMVLQQKQINPVWGKASKGEKVSVSIANQTHRTIADKNGRWIVKLTPIDAGGPFVLTVQGRNKIEIQDVLVGEVWMCSGQSNMQWTIGNSNHADVEVASANYPNIRLMNVPKVGSEIATDNLDVSWNLCTPETVKNFSAIGYLFGKRLHNTLGVPIGLINNAWGGSAIEAWIPRQVLEEEGHDELVKSWDDQIAGYSDAVFEKKKEAYKYWLANGKPGKKKWPPENIRIGRKRPGSIYKGMVNASVGYGIKGIIWCQGETNAGRAYQYRELFPLLIKTYRNLWRQGDFPFYWVQMADFLEESKVPTGGSWAELREAQTMTLSLPNTGEAIVTDVGEAKDIHPRDKQTPANRLVRHALAKDYGYAMASDSPRFSSMEIKENKAIISFSYTDKGLCTFDFDEIKGFAIAGSDKKFVWAKAKIIGKNKVEVYSDNVENPVAVRYGFENNPRVNLYDRNGLPVTNFRTDSWQGVTEGKVVPPKSY